uniref:Uncharacterized protein LOC114347357 n=1 Tax=Diabrotica virgifera virgifera TaxID=50390 RepID=A0A6P7H5Q2_DIAVI
MLHKKGSREDPENYRRIALVNCLTKLFTQILSNRLTIWLDNTSVIPECQNGFRQGRGCLDNIFTLTSAVQLRGGHFSKERGFLLNGQKLESVNKFNYLGVTFSSSSLFREMAVTTIARAKQSIGAVMNLLSNAIVNSWETRITLYNSIILNCLSQCILSGVCATQIL